MSHPSPSGIGRTTVCIVGGGLAGLCAARLLHSAAINFELLEARPRLGGRILSADADGQPSPDGLDLGPSWFWPAMQPALGALARDLGIPSFEQYSQGDVLYVRSRDMPPQRFPAMRQEPTSMRMAGGTAALTGAIAKALPAERLHLSMTARRLTLAPGQVTIEVSSPGGEAGQVIARQVILAAPPRLLHDTLSFEPALAPEIAARWQSQATWMAPHAKFIALYDRAFWRDAGLSGTAQSAVGPLVEIHDATSASGQAALFGFLGIGSRQRSAVGDVALKAAALAQLAHIFGPAAGKPRAVLYKDWAADDLTATGRDHTAGGHPVPDGRPWASGPWAEHLSLGGSETSTTEPGYLAGALEAAERAVRDVRARLAQVPASP